MLLNKEEAQEKVFIEGFQIINIEGMIELENHFFSIPSVIIDLSKDWVKCLWGTYSHIVSKYHPRN